MARILLAAMLAVILVSPSTAAMSQTIQEVPATAFTASDTPSDDGTSITLSWQATRDAPLSVLRATSEEGPFETVGQVKALGGRFEDGLVDYRTDYYYRLAYVAGTDTVFTAAAGPVRPKSNWFRSYRTNALILCALMFGLVVLYIRVARKGKQLFVRRIAGLSAIDEAIGRATEMGRKILYIPGIMSLSEIQTIASLAILRHVAKLTALYGTSIEVPNKDPLTFPAARETVKQAYLEAGKPDQFKEDMVTYLTYDQFAYAASVTGKMVRERPATNFLIGSFFAESLIFAETGQSTGAIQISGTADVTQLPFFVTTCDYTLMGEELFAASAYLSREPVLLGSIKAQDLVKLMLIVFMLAGIAALAFGSSHIKTMLMVS